MLAGGSHEPFYATLPHRLLPANTLASTTDSTCVGHAITPIWTTTQGDVSAQLPKLPASALENTTGITCKLFSW